jgi:hypothetical protein
MVMPNNLPSGFLEEIPEALFSSALQRFGGTPNQQSFFRTQFQPIHDLFQGALAQQVQAGQGADASFESFLEGQNPFVPFGFDAFFRNIPRHLRPGGLRATALNPAFRFITQF